MPEPTRHKKASGARKASSKPSKRNRGSKHSIGAAKSASDAGRRSSSSKVPNRQASIGRRSSSGSSKHVKSASGSPKTEAAQHRRGSSTAAIQDQLRRGSAGKVCTGEPQKKLPGILAKSPGRRPYVPGLLPVRLHRSDDEYSSRERQQIEKRRDQVAFGACVAIAVVVAVLAFSGLAYIIVTPRNHKWLSSMRGLTLIESMEKACHTDDCRTAVAKMNESVDGTVDPCEDLYHYACGHWRELDDDGEPMSYEDSVTHHYVMAVHGYLTGGAPAAEQCRSDEPSAKIACVYSSCVDFFTNRSSSLSSLLTAADLDAYSWMRAESFDTLFTLIVHKAFHTRLPSVLRVKRQNQSTLDFEFGTCLACCSNDSDFPVRLLDVATEVFPDAENINRSDLLHLDNTLREISQAPWNLPAQGMDAGQFESLDRSTWYRVLADTGAFSIKPEDVQMVSANPRGIDKIVTALYSVPLPVATLYTLLAPVAPYFAVELFEGSRRNFMKTFRAWQICIEDVAFLFTNAFDTSFASSLGTEKAAVSFRNMRSYIQLAAVRALHLGKDLELSKEAMMADGGTEYEDVELEDPAFAETYGEDFMANLILYHRHGRRRFRAARFRSDAKRKSVGIPTNYFLPDYYYSGASEQAVNSGTLGVLTAAMLFRAGYPENAEPMEYAKCFAQYSRYTLKLPVDTMDWRRHTKARWAVETAFAARQGEHEQKEMDAMHYLRFARTYCGEDDAHILSLQFAVRSSENFNRTFECGYTYPVMQC